MTTPDGVLTPLTEQDIYLLSRLGVRRDELDLPPEGEHDD